MLIAFFADTATYRLLNMYGMIYAIFRHLLKQRKGKTQRLVVSCTYHLHKCNIRFSTFIFTP